MQVWLNTSEAKAFVSVVEKEAARTQRRADRAYKRASDISNAAYNLDCLKYALAEAVRSEMDAFDLGD